MDEFGKKLPEFSDRKDEFTQYSSNLKTDDKRKAKQLKLRKRSLLKAFVSGTFVVMITPTIFASGMNEDVNAFADNTSQMSSTVSNDQKGTVIEPGETADTNPGSDQSLITDIGSDKETLIYVECEECHGTGIICQGDPDFGYDRGNGHGYAGCGGTGYSECPDIWCNHGVKIDQTCRGSGKDQRGNECVVCHGAGIVDCEFCHNTGIAECISKDSHAECARCSGTGKIEIEK